MRARPDRKSSSAGATESVTPTASAARVTVTGLPEVLPEAARARPPERKRPWACPARRTPVTGTRGRFHPDGSRLRRQKTCHPVLAITRTALFAGVVSSKVNDADSMAA